MSKEDYHISLHYIHLIKRYETNSILYCGTFDDEIEYPLNLNKILKNSLCAQVPTIIQETIILHIMTINWSMSFYNVFDHFKESIIQFTVKDHTISENVII